MTTTRSAPVPALTSVTINGRHASVAAEPDAVLLRTLRDDLGLTGAKAACEMGECGTCTVLLDDQAVYSCLVLTAECDGHHVETVEGLADGQDLDPIQRSFADHDALQCGFCTPGQIMSLIALRRRVERPDLGAVERPDLGAVERAVAGNLCRCGAYRHILDAACSALGVDGGR